MTHTTTVIQRGVMGDLQYRIVKMDITAHTASGEVITAAEFGLNKIRLIVPNGVTESGYVATWNGALKIICWMGNYDSTDGPLIDAGTADVGEVYLMVYGI